MAELRGRTAAALLAFACIGACSSEQSDLPGPEPAAPDQEKKPDVIYVPTPQDVVDMMLHLAKVRKEDVVYDLGCGDGRVVVTAAKRYGCRATGFDIDPDRVRESRENVRKNGVEHLARIEQKDIFTLDLSGADVVFLYLLPSLNVRLIPQLEKLKPGSRIVSHDFDMEGCRPDAVLTMRSKEDNDREHSVYLWTVPFHREETDSAMHGEVWEFKMDDAEEPAARQP